MLQRDVAADQMMDNHNEADERFPLAPAPRRGLVFGGLAGALFGSLFAVACCWIIDENNPLVRSAVYGALIGSGVGAIIGWLEGRKPRDGVNIATHIGVLYGLPPGLLLFLGVGGGVVNRLSGLMLAGAIFAVPMAGMLIGAILDRIYEGFSPHRRKS